MKKLWISAAVIALSLMAAIVNGPSTAQEAKPDSGREGRMKWWSEARFGMFIHWGLYALPAGEWKGREIPGLGEWIMTDAKIPLAEYAPLQKQFNPVKFDAKKWARLAKNAGMGYVVLTSKHIDGFCMFDSKLTDYDIMGTPFKRDVMKELSTAVRGEGMKMCFYHSVSDFHHPDYCPLGAGSSWPNVAQTSAHPDFTRYLSYMNGQLRELMTNYGPIGVVWFDACYDHTAEDVHADEIVKMLRGIQPDVIVNNRLNCPQDYDTPEQEIPATGIPGRYWETCMTINDTWGYKKNDHNWKSTGTLLRNLIDIVSKGGNYLLNVGPTAQGEFPPEIVERLEGIGRWMSVNKEAIHGTTASPFKRLTWGRSTQKPGTLYLHVFDWPGDTLIVPGLTNKVRKAYLLSDPQKRPLAVRKNSDGVLVKLPRSAPDSIASVVVLLIDGKAEVTPYRVGQAPDGSVTLPAVDATVHGSTARYQTGRGIDNIGYWTEAKDWVSWDFSMGKPGSFDVFITYACEDREAGSEYSLELSGQKLTGKVEGTGGWDTFVTKNLGSIALDTPGIRMLALRPLTMPGGAVMNLHEIRFVQKEDRISWWREARFGMFIHWGLYSQLGRGEWVQFNEKIPVKEYEKLAAKFNPVRFDAEAWVRTAERAGCRYIVITAKHHEGFSMFRTKVSPFNIVDATPFRRDPMAELAAACKQHGIRLCFYYSHVREWRNPLAQSFEGGNNYGNSWDYPDESRKDLSRYVDEFDKPQLRELLTQYGPIGLIWFDTPSFLDSGKAKECADLVHSLQKECLVNSRVGGSPANWDYVSMGDCEVPAEGLPTDWETPMTICDAWGYNSQPDNRYRTPAEVIRILVNCASMGGNLLLNVGPTGEGVIPREAVERLETIGRWMKTNGESIYGTTAGPFRKLAWGRSTERPGKLYLHVFDWPRGELSLPNLRNGIRKAYLLSDPGQKPLAFSRNGSDLTIKLPPAPPDSLASVVVLAIDGTSALPAPEAELNRLIRAYSPQQIIGLDTGETFTFTLKTGERRVIRLLSLKEHRDGVNNLVRSSDIRVEIDGRPLDLVSAPYVLPTETSGIRIQADITQGRLKMPKQVQLSVWDSSDPVVNPGSFGFPLAHFRLFSHGTQAYGEVVHLGAGDDDPAGQLFHHDYGFDMAGYEGREQVVSATEGTVVMFWPSREDLSSVLVQDTNGLIWEYGHLASLDQGIALHDRITRGTKIGILGRTGPSGNFSHLHVGTYLSRSDVEGDRANRRLNLYPWFVSAYQVIHRKGLFAVARPHQVVLAGERVTFDAGNSLVWGGSRIENWRWIFPDGDTIMGAKVQKTFEKAGSYVVTLWIRDNEGAEDVDFCQVKVYSGPGREKAMPHIFMTHTPTMDVRTDQEVTFRFWFQGSDEAGPISIDFGDGTRLEDYKSYTEVRHSFRAAGIHTVSAWCESLGKPVSQKQKVVVTQRP